MSWVLQQRQAGTLKDILGEWEPEVSDEPDENPPQDDPTSENGSIPETPTELNPEQFYDEVVIVLDQLSENGSQKRNAKQFRKDLQKAAENLASIGEQVCKTMLDSIGCFHMTRL